MFTLFLPLIIAFISLSVLLEQPARQGWNLETTPGLAFCGLLLVSLILAQWPRSSKQPHVQRFLMYFFWFGVTYLGLIDQTLVQQLNPYTNGTQITFVLLLAEYWFLDALCMSPIKQGSLKGLFEKMTRSFNHLRLQLPLLILSLVQIGWLVVLEWIMPTSTSWIWYVTELISGLLLVGVAAPFMMIWSWGAKALLAEDKVEIIQDELAANRIFMTKVIAWPEHIIPSITAGIIGIFPGCRYLLISPRLVYLLNQNELRAVIAHEAGHVIQRHLIYFILGYLCFVQLLLLGTIGLSSLELLFEWAIPVWVMTFMGIGALLLFIRLGFGFLSRNFERQADCNSLIRVGLEPFTQAILKVAWVNGINIEEHNWHHYGIQQRLRFLTHCEQSPHLLKQHHRYVRKLKGLCVGLLVPLIVLNIFAASNDLQMTLWKYKWQNHEGAWTSEDFGFLGSLADTFFFEKELEEAEALYRQILSIQPNDVHALNNLAWLLTQHYAEEPQRIQESIQLALQALEQVQAAYIWDTLAEGYRLAKEYDQALEASQRAFQLAQQDNGTTSVPGPNYYQERLELFKNL
ncbi:M48 family metalloprotease [Deltaproteobacteria bacterium TL4]